MLRRSKGEISLSWKISNLCLPGSGDAHFEDFQAGSTFCRCFTIHAALKLNKEDLLACWNPFSATSIISTVVFILRTSILVLHTAASLSGELRQQNFHSNPASNLKWMFIEDVKTFHQMKRSLVSSWCLWPSRSWPTLLLFISPREMEDRWRVLWWWSQL